jgi:sulfur carrier protein ThiS
VPATFGRDLGVVATVLASRAVANVELTRHLFAFFPALADKELRFEAETVADLVRALDAEVPGIAFYICDERGRLRRHVNIFVDGEMVSDRGKLGDRIESNSNVLIVQALSGG